MLALLISLLLSISTCAAARVMPNQQQQPLQQFPMPQEEPLAGAHQTTTLHTTVTSYILYSTITATLTRYTADETTAVPEAVQTWYAAQQEEGCDRTACASCKVWYECGGFGVVCVIPRLIANVRFEVPFGLVWFGLIGVGVEG
ncbi:hypothetical protein Q7P35_005278 [Cladosporium inversicolor]